MILFFWLVLLKFYNSSKWENPQFFCLISEKNYFSLFLNVKFSASLLIMSIYFKLFKTLELEVLGIQTRIFGVEGEPADHLTPPLLSLAFRYMLLNAIP